MRPCIRAGLLLQGTSSAFRRGMHTNEKGTVSDQKDFMLLYLDDYHAGDVLFLQSLARSLAQLSTRRIVLVHGSGEHAERALEAKGIFRTRVDGLLPIETTEEHALVEAALRHVNRKITGILTDAVVPAVGVIGSERGLFRIRKGRLTSEHVGWLEALGLRGVVSVVAAFAVDEGSGRTGEVPVHLAIEAVARSLSMSTHVIAFTTTNLPGVMRGGHPEPSVAADILTHRIVRDVEAITYLTSNDIDVLLTNTTGLSKNDGPIGTRIERST